MIDGINFNGRRYNKLVEINFEYKTGYNQYWKYLCDCGKIKVIRKSHVKYGKTKSCGCYREEIGKENKTHGMSKTKIYGVWRGIQDRIYLKTHKYYKNYGGRGIKCEWNSFDEFYDDMGESYEEGLQIDRIDNNGNYSKSNCRWVTSKQNNRNRRNNRLYKGKCLAEWADITGIKESVIHARIKRYGYSWEEALEFKKRE